MDMELDELIDWLEGHTYKSRSDETAISEDDEGFNEFAKDLCEFINEHQK